MGKHGCSRGVNVVQFRIVPVVVANKVRVKIGVINRRSSS